MPTDNTDVIVILNDLIATCIDGVHGFRDAANAVTGPGIRTLFSDRARSIELAKGELQELVRRLGAEPSDSGHVAASVHRGWINLKSVLTGKDDDAIIAEAERGEEAAVNHYQDALRQTLPAGVRSIVEDQARGAQQNLNIMRALGRSDNAARNFAREEDRAAPPNSR
jgi:uncharacterized protein (TIGR02284 family)